MAHSKLLKSATDHLRNSDPVLRGIIEKVGPCTMTLKTDHYKSLVGSIISQQISTQAARTIFSRFMGLIGELLEPKVVLQFNAAQLRTAGLSSQKASYILDLSRKFYEDPRIYEHLDALSDEEAVSSLTAIKGIGEWTAHMFLIFSLGRVDILPLGDIGFQNALMRHYELKQKPSRKEMKAVAQPWKPYRSVGVWYLWAAYDQKT